MSLINKTVPEFKANAFHSGNIEEVTNESIKGKWSVFVFYPADFTFVCPTELSDLADNYEEFVKAGCEVYSVSCDTEFVHKAWAEASPSIAKIKYPMLADPAGILARAFDVMIEGKGQALRGSFVVDPDGVIKAYEINDTPIGRDAGELLRKVQAAQFVTKYGDQVCPAKWKPGKETLKPGLDLVGKI